MTAEKGAAALNELQKFVAHIPTTIPQGQILCHNQVRHTPTMPIGKNGFRVWLADSTNERYERCECGWGKGVKHYRAKRLLAD
jgi:hypothetical protein